MLRIYDTQRRQKEEFRPVDPESGRIGLYYCGPTVYDSIHLGHARAAVVPDMMRRYLESRGYSVRWVANFTDVDDKIIRRAIRERRDWREITSYYMDEYARIVSAIGNRPPDARPRATDHIPEMVDLVASLIERERAYVAPSGDVYFDTAAFDDYGALSGRRLDEQESNRDGRLRDEQVADKRNPTDFILWKLLANDPEEFLAHPEFVPGWDSPWGRGRPGWHLECSALSRTYLGMPFDIHGGGLDLIFPHHENERAQNDCGYCDELGDGSSVRYWVHNAFVTLAARSDEEAASEYADEGGVKMSKSLGNVRWLREMIWPEGPLDPMAVRYTMLACHYRSPLRYSPELLESAAARADRLYATIERLAAGFDPETVSDEPSEAAQNAAREARDLFESGMDDDFNTPVALSAIDQLQTWANRELGDDASPADRRLAHATLQSLAHTLGLRTERLGGGSGDADVEPLLGLLASLRGTARAEKSWAIADRVRDGLKELGYTVRDGKDGKTTVEPA